MSIKDKLIQEYLESKKELKQVVVEQVSDRTYENDQILVSIRNRCAELIRLGFKDAAIAHITEYVSRNHPNKLEFEVSEINKI